MKKFVLVVLGFILGALATYFYCCGVDETTQEQAELVKPKGVITPAQAEVLDENWTKTRKPAVDSAAGRPDNRSAWWPLQDLKDYLAYAEKQTHDLGYKMEGIRVYLGVYPGNAPNGRADYTTMFMVPTGRKSPAEASFNFLNFWQGGGGDILDGDGFNGGEPGHPPNSNYPQ